LWVQIKLRQLLRDKCVLVATRGEPVPYVQVNFEVVSFFQGALQHIVFTVVAVAASAIGVLRTIGTDSLSLWWHVLSIAIESTGV
jgi:hypothetical protein